MVYSFALYITSEEEVYVLESVVFELVRGSTVFTLNLWSIGSLVGPKLGLRGGRVTLAPSQRSRQGV